MIAIKRVFQFWPFWYWMKKRFVQPPLEINKL